MASMEVDVNACTAALLLCEGPGYFIICELEFGKHSRASYMSAITAGATAPDKEAASTTT